MKRILSVVLVILMSASAFAWTGGGWLSPIRVENDSVKIGWNGLPVLINGAVVTAPGSPTSAVNAQADTLSPYSLSTVYMPNFTARYGEIRNLTVDTVLIRKYFHEQQVALFDSTLEIVGDGDTLRFDASINGNVIEYEDENVTVWNVDSAGTQTITKPGIGTLPTTAATVNALGLVLQNTTAASNGAQQDSPPLRFSGYGWATTGGTSKSADWIMVNRVSQGTNPSSSLSWEYSLAGAAYSSVASLNNVGSLTANYLTGSIFVRANLTSVGTTSTDGILALSQTAATSSVPVHYSPRSRWTARVWSTAGAGSSEDHSFIQEVIPQSGLTPGSDSTRMAIGFNDSGDGATYSEIMSLRGDGNLGLGTTNPLFDLSIVNSNPAANNGIHIVDSNVNKNRTTYAQATDSASAALSMFSGRFNLRLRGPTGVDTSGIYTYLNGITLHGMQLVTLKAGAQSISFSHAGAVATGADDYGSLGTIITRFQNFNITDNGRIGGKGQTAKLTIGTMNTMTEETDSCVVVTPVNGSGSVKLASAAGQIVTDMGVQPATYTATIGDMWLSRNGGTTPRDTLWIKVTADSSAYVVFGARELKH